MSRQSAGSSSPAHQYSLFHRRFLALCIVVFFASTSYSTFYVYPYQLRSLGMDERDIGLVMGAVYFGALLGMPVTAKMMRVASSRRIMALGLASLSTTNLLLTLPTTLLGICGSRLLQGFVWSTILITSNVFATTLARPERLAQGLTIYGAFFISGQAAGPIVAELITGPSRSFDYFFIASAALAAIVLPLVPFLPNTSGSVQDAAQRPPMRWRQTIRPLASTFLLTIPYAAATSFVADYAQIVGLPTATTDFFSGFLIASLLIRFGGGYLLDIFQRPKVICAGGVLAAAGCLFLAVLGFAWQLWAAGGLLGFATSIYYPTLQALLVERSEDRVSVVTASVFTITFALTTGSAIGGTIAELVGYPALFSIMAIISLVGGGLMLTVHSGITGLEVKRHPENQHPVGLTR
jgi:MFS family permease